MKCSICGYRANSIKGMGQHYRKKHPRTMKRKKTKSRSKSHGKTKYCSKCGQKM